MPEYVFDEAFEHRLERMLREMGNEAVRPFDPYETTQLVVTNTRIGGVPFVQPPMPKTPGLYPPPLYPEDEQSAESRRWPLMAALVLLVAALGFTGIATGFIHLPSNLGITIGSPAPLISPSPVTSPSPVITSSPGVTSTPERTRRPRRPRSPAPATLQPETPAPETAVPPPTDTPTSIPTLEPPTIEPTQFAVPTTEPVVEPSGARLRVFSLPNGGHWRLSAVFDTPGRVIRD